MSIVNIADTKAAPKQVAAFGTVRDLAHGLIREWVDANRDLRDDCDSAMSFIFDVLTAPPVERNRLASYIYHFRLNRHRRKLRAMMAELRYISTEVESLIGNATFLKAGLKNKIKNKKQFDDVLEEYREITSMLLGITMCLKHERNQATSWTYEIEVIAQLKAESMNRGFYEVLLLKIGLFEFK